MENLNRMKVILAKKSKTGKWLPEKLRNLKLL